MEKATQWFRCACSSSSTQHARIFSKRITGCPLFAWRGHSEVRTMLEFCLRGSRYGMRPFQTTDAVAVARHADDPRIAARLRDGFPSPYTLADAQHFIAAVAGTALPTVLAIVTAEDEAIGSIGLTPGLDVHRRVAELGYWLGVEHWGRGVVSAAVVEITRYGFGVLDLLRIHADPFHPHPASERVLAKAGYHLESIARASAFKNGRVCDQAIWVRLRDDVDTFRDGSTTIDPIRGR
jgi:RimJ/RimL family protein N-acetyltransferase